MENYHRHKNAFEAYLRQHAIVGSPNTLYEPVEYIMHLDGKRFRPVLLLMAAQCFGEINDNCLKVALGVEVFHNFTLVHDDIMDKADKRRGSATVHKKYNINTALLAGDLMLIKASQIIHEVSTDTGKNDLVDLFLKTATDICEGQQWDMDFERSIQVEINQYLHMIRSKTAVLLGYALYAGARLSDMEISKAKALFDFGTESGMAFQIWDDYLDVFGSKDTGKIKAGDIFNKKETFLIIQLREHLSKKDRTWFDSVWTRQITSKDCEQIIGLMKKYEIDVLAEKYSQEKMEAAITELKKQLPSGYDYSEIVDLAENFINRKR